MTENKNNQTDHSNHEIDKEPSTVKTVPAIHQKSTTVQDTTPTKKYRL